MSAAVQSWGSRSGVVGLLARMVVFALIGIFVVKVAHDYNPHAKRSVSTVPCRNWLTTVTARGCSGSSRWASSPMPSSACSRRATAKSDQTTSCAITLQPRTPPTPLISHV
jgi:hypothetical protein